MRTSFRRQAYNVFFRLSPLLILVLLELSLRFLGIGESYELFLRSEDKQYYDLNPKYYLRYINIKQFPDIPVLDQRFSVDKPENASRIFLIGDHSLSSLFPDANTRKIIPDFYDSTGHYYEIIQLAVPLGNSFSVTSLAREVERYDADALVLISGANEHYGIPRKSPWMQDINNYGGISAYVTLKKYRFLQVLDRFVYLRKDDISTFPPADLDDWSVPYRSREYEETLSHFDRNIRRMTRKADIPLFMVSLPEHIKVPPYRSLFDDKELSDADIAKECAVLVHNADRFSIKRWINDLKAWEPETAIYYYCLGMIAERAGQTEDALKHYRRALELDVFRVRSDPNTNDLIVKHSGEWDGLNLIDVREHMMRTSQNGLRINRYFQNPRALNPSGRELFINEIKKNLTDHFGSGE
ncbi:MAG: tetratricopeptide repeat protein [FCB group bacterium]|nr:tetratricopeptide repeat protein [FCB group bacterium]